MLKLTVDPVVLAKLKTSFPKAKSAQKGLDKYLRMLEDMLFKAELQGRSNYEVLFNFYSIPLREFSQKGPRIGEGKMRLHSWLAANGVELVQAVLVGSNLNKRISQVKLSQYVFVQRSSSTLGEKIIAAASDAEIDQLLDADKDYNHKLFASLYPDFYLYLSHAERDKVFDVLPIDIKSLKAYIIWLNTKAVGFSANKIQHFTDQAKQILAIATHTGGNYYQRKKRSKFGRMYYEGLSVQNVNKTLRRAMLGDCWEYDMSGSVIAFKMGLVKEYVCLYMPDADRNRVFFASRWYLAQRKEFLAEVRRDTFAANATLSKDFQNQLIKEAITAISFGARASECGWKSQNGTWSNPALVNIFQNPVERSAFLASSVVKAFISEQASLDSYIFEGFQTEAPELLCSPLLSAGIKPSKSKAVAYLYQHHETDVMNMIREKLLSYGIQPIANIHDAFIVRKKLSLDVLDQVLCSVRMKTGNEHWFLKPTKLEGFTRERIDDVDVGLDLSRDELVRCTRALMKSLMLDFVEDSNSPEGDAQ